MAYGGRIWDASRGYAILHVLLHYRNHVMTRYYGLHYGYRSFVRGNYRPGQMLDAIIIARFAIVEKGGGGRGEGDGKMGSPFLFEGNGIFVFEKSN